MTLTLYILALKLNSIIIMYSQLLLKSPGPLKFIPKQGAVVQDFCYFWCSLSTWANLPLWNSRRPPFPTVTATAPLGLPGPSGAPANPSGNPRGGAGTVPTGSRERLQRQAGKAGRQQSKPASNSSPLLRSVWAGL